MGRDIDQTEFTARDYEQFSHRVHEELNILRGILKDESFGDGPGSIGAELEFYIVDQDGLPKGINKQLLEASGCDQLQAELNRFNIECNLHPQKLSGSPFTGISTEISEIWNLLNQLSSEYDSSVVPIGILPTLRKSDFRPESMTDLPRYHALAKGLRRMRGGPFSVEINGRDRLHVTLDDVTLEGANTSFQFHWRVPNRQFVDTFNAIQMLTPLTVALGANSPFFLCHDLWDETRISLFKQSIDVRGKQAHHWREPARVDFGQGWLRRSPIELFELGVSLYPPLLPVLQEDTGFGKGPATALPLLPHLNLHHGTTWTWNRVIYDPSEKGHLRIELRSMPAGPTVEDMLATAAFTIGCAHGLADRINTKIACLPFKYAEYNFYAAAREGLASQLVWPSARQITLKERACSDIILELIPVSQAGLESLGVDSSEAKRLLSLIRNRVQSGQTGAAWQRNYVQKLEPKMERKEACQEMFSRYRTLQASGNPVSEWSVSK